MFAIVDVSRRATRGLILMLVDDQPTATEIAVELTRRGLDVSLQAISSHQLDQFNADARSGGAGTVPVPARAIA